MKPPFPKRKKRKRIKWLKRLGPIVILAFLVPVGLFTLGWLNRDLIVDGLQQWYNNNHNGTLKIGRIEANLLRGFPDVSFTIDDIYQSETDTISDRSNVIKIDQAEILIGAGDLIRGNIRFKEIKIRKAQFLSKVNGNKSYDYHINLKSKKKDSVNSGFKLPNWLHPKKAKISIRGLNFISRDNVLHKNFDLEIHQLDASYTNKKEKIEGILRFDIITNALGFNTTKGAYINGGRVIGAPRFNINIEDDVITFPEFDLKIDAQEFKMSADFLLKGITSYKFHLKNDELDFGALKKFLPDSLRSKLNTYDISEPLTTSLDLSGKFEFRDNPELYAEFSTLGNAVTINDDLLFNKVNFNGYLTNRIYENDSLASLNRSKKDVQLYFNNFTAVIDSIDIEANDSYYQTSPEVRNLVHANLKINGPNSSLASVLQNDNFEFRGGNFNLEALVHGNVQHPFQAFNHAKGNFYLNDTRAVLKKNGLQLPIDNIQLRFADETSILERIEINLPNGENLILKGTLENISAILEDEPLLSTSSFVTLDANSLDIDELIITANELIPNSVEKRNNRQTVHETINAFYSKFHPRFMLDLGSVSYGGVTINDLHADMAITDPATISLTDFIFEYENAMTEISGTFKVPESAESRVPMFINVDAGSSGPIEVFQNLFNIELVDINEGQYTFSGNITGNVQHFEELLDNAVGKLDLHNAKFYYPHADLDIAFDSLSVDVENSNIKLKQVEMEVGELYPFTLNGEIKRFPNILLDNVRKGGSVFLNVHAPYVNADDWINTVESLENENVTKTAKRELSKAFEDINRLKPEIVVVIDSLKYQDIITEKVDAQVYFESDSVLKLDHLNINYRNSEALLTGSLRAQQIDSSAGDMNPFNFNLNLSGKGNNRDLNDYLKTVNFVFNSGEFEFKGSYDGEAADLSILNSNASGELKLGKSTVDFKAADIQIPIDSLNVDIENDFANIRKLKVQLPGKSSIQLTGSIDNFSNFVNNINQEGSHISIFNIFSPHLDTKDITTFFGEPSRAKDSSTISNFDLSKLKTALNNINASYYPTITVQIDSLIHKNLSISDFYTDVGFDNEGKLNIQEANVEFYDGSLSLGMDVDVTKEIGLPVAVRIMAENINLEKLVKGLEYFNDSDLKQAEKISGKVDFTIDGTALMNNDGSINLNSLNGIFNLNLQDLALYNYEPLMEKIVLLKKERFKKLQFRPIQQTFQIVNGELQVPRTEIQSSAVHIFVEGKMKFEDYINIWVSVPWKNLKSNDGLSLPEKKSYEDSGSKFYLQLIQDKQSKKEREQKLKVKFRLSNNKMKKSLEEDN